MQLLATQRGATLSGYRCVWKYLSFRDVILLTLFATISLGRFLWISSFPQSNVTSDELKMPMVCKILRKDICLHLFMPVDAWSFHLWSQGAWPRGCIPSGLRSGVRVQAQGAEVGLDLPCNASTNTSEYKMILSMRKTNLRAAACQATGGLIKNKRKQCVWAKNSHWLVLKPELTLGHLEKYL